MADNPQTAAGGADIAVDPSNEKDRALMRTAMTRWPKRWAGLTDEKKDFFAKILGDAAEKAGTALQSAGDVDTQCKVIGEIASIVRTAVMMEAQNQSDEHKHEAYERVDSGKPTEFIRHDGITVEVPEMK